MSDTATHGFGTRVIHGGQKPDPLTGAVMPPIYATSTYVQSSPGVHKGYEYSRTANPTRDALQASVANLEGGAAGFAFSSGLAASATILDLLDSGSHIIAMHDLYGGSYRLFENVRKRSAGHDVSFVDLTDATALEAALRPNTRMIWVETPDQPAAEDRGPARRGGGGEEARHHVRVRQHVCHALSAAAAGTWVRPRRALDHEVPERPLGCDWRRGGCPSTARMSCARRLTYLQNAVGGVPGPFDSFLTLRGIKTLALRMERHCCECAGDCAVPRNAREGRARDLPGPGEPSAA